MISKRKTSGSVPLSCCTALVSVSLSSYTEVSDWSRITNLWLLGSINSSPRLRKGRGVTVTTRAKSRRRRENTSPWRSADVTGSSLTRVHCRPLPFSRWYCMVGPGVRYRSRKAWWSDEEIKDQWSKNITNQNACLFACYTSTKCALNSILPILYTGILVKMFLKIHFPHHI